MKQQVMVIHGGDTFDTYEEYMEFLMNFELDFNKTQSKFWKDTLSEKLGVSYEVIYPRMPNALNAKYAEWKIWFEKYIPHLRDGVILIGHSLGGIFLAKYLSENALHVHIKATFLVSAPHDAEGSSYSLVDFVLPKSLGLLEEQGGKIFLIHSSDDPVVKFVDVDRYAERLPRAEKMLFTDREHFSQHEFPELVAKIKELVG